MTKDVEDYILNCNICAGFQRSNTKEPLMPKEVPNGPWEVLGTDLYYLDGKNYLIVIDYFSKFVEIASLQDVTSAGVIVLLKSFFARHGIPKIVYSDNGPQYACKEFKNFARSWNFEHKTSSPEYPQSNGMVERHVQTVKLLLQKAVYDNKDPYLALLEYRNTPISNEIPSPCEIMYGRKINGLMPIKENFYPREEYGNIKKQLLERQNSQKKYYDRSTKELHPMKAGENVFIAQGRKGPMEKARIVSEACRPRSYRLQKEDGRIIERNRRSLHRGTGNMKFTVRKQHYGNNEEQNTMGQHLNKGSETSNGTNLIDPRDVTNPGECSNPDVTGSNQIFTRSGRVVNKPIYLRDYV